MAEEAYKLKKLLKELGAIKGRHTELVSVYVPSGYSITDIGAQIKNEQGTAINIKSKAVRKNVVGALERIVQHLKLYKHTPPNGLAKKPLANILKVANREMKVFNFGKNNVPNTDA